MKQPRASVVLLVLAVVSLGLFTGTSTRANAAAGTVDDRRQITPTSWWTYTGVTAAALSNYLDSNGARLTSLQVDDASGPTFTAVMVRNTGTYATGWWWYYGQTRAAVSSLLATNHARLISAYPYSTTSGTRYAVVMVPNRGVNAMGWWYIGTIGYLSTQLSMHHARPIELNPMPGSTTQYLALMVKNTGTNGTAWWWYLHQTVPLVSSHLSTNRARLVDLSRNADGTFNVVMYANPDTRWYWYVNSSPSEAVNRSLQQGERIIDVTSYVISGTTYYAVIETRNTNAVSETLWNIIGPKVDSGSYGFYLKQVGGGLIAGLNENSQYEPASALKVLYHAKSIHEESLGTAHDGDEITFHYFPGDSTNPGICPDSFAATATTNLKDADQQMMWVSDNRMTRGILEKYGKPAMLGYAASLGMTATAINHNIGCPTSTTPNRTTLADLGKVYEAYQNNTITSNRVWKREFRARMLNETNYPGFKAAACPVVNQIANSIGKSAATATAFCDALTWITKGGSYQYGGVFPYAVSWDGVSMIGVPYKSGGGITRKLFIFGEYVDGTVINSVAEEDSVKAARAEEFVEAMRPYIRGALLTWH